MSRMGSSAQSPADGKNGGFTHDLEALREHVREITESAAFRGSRRGQQFLRHVIEKVINGHSDELKERNLGVELFGRAASYDTGEDAIVRVTASDVRKRLHQFYAETSVAAPVRIDLPAGSYIPELVGNPTPATSAAEPGNPPAIPPPVGKEKPRRRPTLVRVAPYAVVAVVAAVAGALCEREWAGRPSPKAVPPWSILLRDRRPMQVIFSDPDISTVQELLGFHISLSEYANRRYIPDWTPPDTEIRKALRSLRGVNVASVDVGIALRVAELAHAASEPVVTRQARNLQLENFRTDDNFVLLGSPRSNPWGALFEDQLDFEFTYDESLKQEVIRNKRPQGGELPRYVPTAKSFETGEAFALLAFVGNPGQNGSVLLLAGTNAEATEAVGRLAVDLNSLSRTLQQSGIDPRTPPGRFEILLQVRTLAGSPTTFEVVACHRLPKKAV